MKSLVVTSINPAAKVEHQRICFERWQSLGTQAITCNTETEAQLLTQQGFPEGNIRLIREDHAGKALFGKPVPLIMPLLDSFQGESHLDYIILANSDIFPAIRSGSIVSYWASQAPALALTREETHELSAHDFESASPYRGGLDIFFFKREALVKVRDVLGGCKSSARMAFGVPGWDYLMAAAVLSSKVGGRVRDSHVLLHQSHRPTYGNMNEFAHYVQDLKQLKTIGSDDPALAAEEFASLIERECRDQSSMSRMGKIIYYKRPEQKPPPPASCPELQSTWQRLDHLAPGMGHHYRKRTVISLFERLAEDPESSLETAWPVLCNSKSTWYQFTQALYAIVLSLEAQSLSRHVQFTWHYPKENQHRAALINILNRHDENDPLRRLWIARLFGSELVNHGIFNPRLYDYLVLATENDSELSLIQEILNITQKEKTHAA